MTTWINSQFPRPDFHRQVQRHYGLQDTGIPPEEALLVRPRITGQQPIDLGLQLGVAGTHLPEQDLTLGGGAPEGCGEEGADLPPPLGRHLASPPSWPRSQARATRQSPSTVAAETSSASANLGDGQPGEEPQGNDQALPLVQRDQPVDGLVQGDDVEVLRLEVGEHVVQRHPFPTAGALGRVASAGMVDQDLAHGLGGGGEEVRAGPGP